MSKGGAKGHTPHRPHAGDRQLAGLVRRSVRPGEVPTMGGAAPTGRATGAGRPRGARPSEIQQNRPGLLPPAGSTKALESRTKILKKAAKIRQRVSDRLSEDVESKRLPSGKHKSGKQVKRQLELDKAGAFRSPDVTLSRGRRRELGRTSRRVGELEREFIPVSKRRK